MIAQRKVINLKGSKYLGTPPDFMSNFNVRTHETRMERIRFNSSDEGFKSAHSSHSRKIHIKALKSLVLEKFPKESALRSALLAERDVLTGSEFVAKMETWLNLLQMSPRH